MIRDLIGCFLINFSTSELKIDFLIFLFQFFPFAASLEIRPTLVRMLPSIISTRVKL